MASYEETLVSITLTAHDDIVEDVRPPVASGVNPSANQYRFVKVSGDHECDLYDGTETGDIAVGVLQNKPVVEEMACTVGIAGVSLVEAGGEVDAGAAIEANADGKAIAADGGPVLGIALYGGDDGELIPVLLRLTGEAVAG